MLDSWSQDLRHGFRLFIRNPGTSLIVILTLGVAIGANTSIFSVVSGVFLKSLPYKDPDQVVLIWQHHLERSVEKARISFPNYLDWREQNTVFEEISVFDTGRVTLASEGEPEEISASRVQWSLFPTLGVEAVLGRTFTPEETTRGAEGTVVVSYRVWQERFAGADDAIGQTLALGPANPMIIGVMPPGFDFPDQQTDVWMPMRADIDTWDRDTHFLTAVARLDKGVSLREAQSNMTLISERLAREYPGANAGWGTRVVRLHTELVGDAGQILILLFTAVGLILFIACLNIANLLLSKSIGRRRELAARTVFGAGRGRLLRQMLTESVILAIPSGIVGIAVALMATPVLIALGAGMIPREEDIAVNAGVLGFNFVIALLTVLVFGLIPALQASKLNPSDVLRVGDRTGGFNPRQIRLQNTLVVAAVALAMVLLVGASLLIQSFIRLQNTEPGFDTENILTFDLFLPGYRYPASEVEFFYDRLLRRLESIPGVESVGAASVLPLTSEASGTFTVKGRQTERGKEPLAHRTTMTPDYFRTAGIAILKGRPFETLDDSEGPGVVIINQAFVRRFWSDGDPIGSEIKFGRVAEDGPWREVVGITEDVKHTGLDTEAEPKIYTPLAQVPARGMTVLLRGESDPSLMASALRSEVWALDKRLPINNIRTVEDVLERSLARPRFRTVILMSFAILVLILVIVGTYSVASYSVNQRFQEFGIRMALGAQRQDVLTLVLKQGLKLALVGILIGFFGTIAVNRTLQSQLFEISPADPATFILISLLLVLVSVFANFLPAWQATRVHPSIALRDE